jgi:hypothetical protein
VVSADVPATAGAHKTLVEAWNLSCCYLWWLLQDWQPYNT